jgi:hypothetical protein
MATTYRAAWVPDDDPHRDWEAAAALAVDRVLDDAASNGGRPVLVTNAFGVEQNVPSLRQLLQHGEQVTPRSRRGARSGSGPVLAYVPYGDALELAVQLARGASLCVVETESFPVSGWARSVGAEDLARGEVAQPFPSEIVKELDRLIFYGNNGWTRGFGANQTSHVLTQLRQSGFDDLAAVVGYAGAYGKSAKAMERLRKLALNAGFTETPTSDWTP